MAAALTATRSGCTGLKHVLRHSPVECLPKVLGGTTTIHIATLKATYGEKYPYSEPFPYWKKKYGLSAMFFDRTIPRLNENSKVLVVEGNIGVGKAEFAQRLAKEFDLKFIGPSSDTAIYTGNDYKFDVRALDPLLPEATRSYDLKRFLSDKHPEKGTVGRMMLEWYPFKFFEYAEALKHVVSTGQGVVMVRSVFSDLVFVDAMRRMGYVKAPFVKYYNEFRDNSICELLKPHMTIYLDAPVSVIRERINQRKNPVETGSKVLSDAYLQAIADVYRDKFLPKMRESGEVVEIDWTEKGTDQDMDVIAEELQLYKLEPEDNEDAKFADWSRLVEDDWNKLRSFLSSKDAQLHLFVRPLPYDSPEVLFTQDDAAAYSRIIAQHPVWAEKRGWSPRLGHNTMFKLG
jgi:NADH dehydrogenase (ubiquinone) 1 alpha subcomplex subunit 10